MLSKKLRKLSIKEDEKNGAQEEDEINNNNEIKNQEIIIVNVDNKSESDEEEINIGSQSLHESKYLKTKPKPIFNVDPNSIQIYTYTIDTKPKSNYSYESYDNNNIQNIMNKYNSNISNYGNKNENKTYQIYDPSIEEIKDKYQIKNIKRNILEKEVKPSYRYIPGTYRNNLSYNLNNTFNVKKNINKHFYIKNNKQNNYFNYGPIYNYERAKEIKNYIISTNNENGINKKNISEYKISNPYNTINNKTYYLSEKEEDIPINQEKNNSIEVSSPLNKTYIRKDYPNLYYFNYYKKFSSLDNDKNEINNRKIYSVERPRRLRKNKEIRRNVYNSINNIENSKSCSYKKNNSMIGSRNNNNDIYDNNLCGDSHLNSFLLRNNNKKENVQNSYIINDVENLYQYYPSYNKSNGFSGNSSFSKINYY